jgi:hypothetical protein
MLFFQFPEDARWNDERDAVEFSVILGSYEGTVRIARASSRGSSINVRRPSGASRRTISSGPGSR